MCVRRTARLHRRYLPWMIEIGDVEDSYALESFSADRIANSLSAAIHARAALFNRHEKQIAVHGEIRLSSRTDERRPQARAGWIGDVPNHEPVEAALEGESSLEREVRVHYAKASGILRVEESLRPLGA
jgi:hypothetical protein